MFPNPAFIGYDPAERRRNLAAFLPVVMVVIGEAIAYSIAIQRGATQPTSLSIAVSSSVALTGIITVAARPQRETRLAGILAVLLAGLLVVPMDINTVNVASPRTYFASLPFLAVLRFFNGSLVITVGLHLVSIFPPRSPHAARWTPSDVVIFTVYVVTLVLGAALLIAPPGRIRLLLWIPIIIWFVAVLGLAHLQLIQVIRDPDPNYARSGMQARLLLLGFLAAETPILLRLLLFGLGVDRTVPYNVILAFQLMLPLAVTYAVLRYDLFDIDAAVRRALAYTAATAALLGLYFGLTLQFSRALANLAPRYQGAAVFVALVLAALAFRLVYGFLQHTVDLVFYPERLRFAQVIEDVRGRLQQIISREEVHALLTEELPRRLDAEWARLALAPEQDVPAQPAPAWRGRLAVGGNVLGWYTLGPRQSGLRFDDNERAQLQAVVDQAALALAYADVLDELNDLNRNLEQKVAEQTAQMLDQQRALAVAEERRRLARDLHDSVTQTLFSMSLGLRALRKQLRQDPEAVAVGLAEQETAAQQALAEMRALLAQLRTPLLGGDLVQALRSHCAHLRQRTGLLVHLETPDSIDLPDETAAELLYIAKEALHNVVKYAGVSSARCQLALVEDGVTLTIEDNGNGFDLSKLSPGVAHGLGLENMRVRAEKVGGALSIETEPGEGVVVRVHAPLGGDE